MIALLLLLGCGARQAPGDLPETRGVAFDWPALMGDWRSGPCGSREYERRLELRDDGTWTATDLVSPCPPDVTCVWSGIVISKGTWSENADHLGLEETEADRPAGVARPTRLIPRPDGSAQATEDAGTCTYVRP